MVLSLDPGLLAGNMNAAGDMNVTTTPTALPDCPARTSDGVLVISHPDNDPACRFRVASNADATHGFPVVPGQAVPFRVDDGHDLKACLEAGVAGPSKLIVMPV